MSLDRTSESIAHFSGLFEKTLEEARLRQEYTEFKAIQQKEADDAEYAFAAPNIKTKLDAGDYDPDVRYVPKAPPADAGAAQLAPAAPAANTIDLTPGYVPPAFTQGPEDGGDSAGPAQDTVYLPFVPIPASVATITLQSITLQDDDIFGDVDNAGFVPVELFHALLTSVVQIAEVMAPWSSDTLAQDILSDPNAVHAFRAELEVVKTSTDLPSTVWIASDEAVHNIHVNGTVVDESPEYESLLPTFIAAKREGQADEASDQETLAGDAKGETGLFDDLGGLVSSFAMSGHNVTSGANEAHNVVDLQTSWIDAAVIAVKGDYVSLNAVSQINILSDHNYVNGHRQDDANAESKAYNIASVVEKEDEIAPTSSSELPLVWNTVYYEGDVTVTNVVKQHTFVTDNDQMQLTFTANSTALVMGENQTFNVAELGEFGMGYDLIFVGGSMTSVNVVNQTNVLLDDDYFSGAGLNQAAISDGDNLLHNKAEIIKQGKDKQVEMQKEFKDALKELKKAEGDLMKAVAKSSAFEGIEALRVLQIDGNLTQMNIVDQVNYMGDQDQVQMAKDALMSAIDNVPVSITTGSNLLSNHARIEDIGYDLDIMTGGDYYNEALLYQAELIDTDADPLGVNINALANEAVAFLVDDIIATTMSERLAEAGFTDDAHTGGHTFDVMQAMTA